MRGGGGKRGAERGKGRGGRRRRENLYNLIVKVLRCTALIPSSLFPLPFPLNLLSASLVPQNLPKIEKVQIKPQPIKLNLSLFRPKSVFGEIGGWRLRKEPRGRTRKLWKTLMSTGTCLPSGSYPSYLPSPLVSR